MWNNMGGDFDGGSGGGGGGGFMNSSQFASPAGQDSRKARKSQNLMPVTLQSVLSTSGETFEFCGREAHMIVIVGLIRAVDVTSTKITYTVDDATGTMEAIQWIESDEEDDARSPLMEMTYCRVSGSVRTHQEKRHIMAFSIEPITDLNLITTHILEVMHVMLKLQHFQSLKEAEGSGQGASMMSNSLVGASSFDGNSAGGGGFAGMQGLSGQQRIVYQTIHQSSDETGVARDVIYASLKGKLGHPQVDQVLDFLSSEGHIYSTIDDDHFKSTDG